MLKVEFPRAVDKVCVKCAVRGVDEIEVREFHCLRCHRHWYECSQCGSPDVVGFPWYGKSVLGNNRLLHCNECGHDEESSPYRAETIFLDKTVETEGIRKVKSRQLAEHLFASVYGPDSHNWPWEGAKPNEYQVEPSAYEPDWPRQTADGVVADDAPSALARSAADRLVWKGTVRAWGELILQLYHEGQIEASSPMAALEKASKHFIRKGGKPFEARSVWQNLRNRKNFEGK